MAKAGQRKCMSCGEFFLPDHPSGERQRFCCAAECRRASKAASQAAWLARPPNNDYFSGPVHVALVQAWRAAHPGYSLGKGAPRAPANTGANTGGSVSLATLLQQAQQRRG